MSISPQKLTTKLSKSKFFSELRKYANEHFSMMSAVHDSVICVACGRFGSSTHDDRLVYDCRDFYLTAADMWLKRPERSFGREARNVSNILQAGAKLRVDSHNEVMRRLFDEALRMSEGFEAQHASNSIWAAATMGVDDPRVVNGLARACLDRMNDFNPQCAMNSLWAIASLGVSDAHVISALSQACVDCVRDFNPQNAANSIWAIASLGVSDAHVIAALSQACVDRVRDFNPQEAANSIWAIATLGVSDAYVISALAQACVDRVRDFKPQEAANSIWAIASLGVSDAHVISALSQACVDCVRDFNPQDASNSLWAIATLSVSNVTIISALAQACVDRIDNLSPQATSNVLWSAAILNITITTFTRPLTSAVSERFKSLTRVDDAQQCLQAHYSGLTLSDEAVKHFHAILLTHPEPTSITNSQRAVSSTLTRLGYTPQLEVPVFNGLVTTDIVIEKPSSDGSGRLITVSIEFDGPTHYLCPAMGSRDRVGPIDAKTRLRNALLKTCGEFEVLITIPFYEWDEVEGRKKKEEEYMKKKLSTLMARSNLIIRVDETVTRPYAAAPPLSPSLSESTVEVDLRDDQ